MIDKTATLRLQAAYVGYIESMMEERAARGLDNVAITLHRQEADIILFNLQPVFAARQVSRKFLPPGSFYGMALTVTDEPSRKGRVYITS